MTRLTSLVICLTLITLESPAAVDRRTDSMLRVNRKFGIVSTKVADRIIFNPRNFYILKTLDYSALRRDNAALATREAKTLKNFASMNTEVNYQSDALQHRADEMFRTRQKAISSAAGYTFRTVQRNFDNFMRQLYVARPLPISWNPDTTQVTANGTHSRNKRFAQFLAPMVTSIIGASKLIAPMVGSALLQQAAEAIAKKGMGKATSAMTEKHANYVTTKTYVDPDLTTEQSAEMNFDEWPLKGDHYAYKTQYHLFANDANLLKYSDMIAVTQHEQHYLQNQRDIQTLRINQFMNNIQQVQRGTVPVDFFPVHELQEMLTEIDKVVELQNLQVQHIAKPTAPFEFYDLLAPLIIMDSANYRLILILVLPLAPLASQMSLFNLASLPFLTHEQISVEVQLQEPFFATDQLGQSHTLLSQEQWAACTRTTHAAICHIPRPIATKQALCYNALHFRGTSDKTIFQSCQFRKADATKPRFLHIAANHYAFFLPTPAHLVVSCPGKQRPPETALASRSGTFIFPDNCFATLAEYTFYDTSMTRINTTVIDPTNSSSSFMDIAQTVWPDIISREDKNQLIIAAQDNHFPESLPSLSARARILEAFKNLNILGEETTTYEEFVDQLSYYIAGISIFISCQLLTCLWQCIFRQCPEKRTYDLPKVSFKTKPKPETAVTTISAEAAGQADFDTPRGPDWQRQHDILVTSGDETPPWARRRGLQPPRNSVLRFGHLTATEHTGTSFDDQAMAAHARDVAIFEASHAYTGLAKSASLAAPPEAVTAPPQT
jgi:hypothetical protein